MPSLRPRVPCSISSSSLCFGLFSFSSSMATLGGHDMHKAVNNGQGPEAEEAQKIEKEREEEKKMEKMIEEKIGLPPEKPLPGDCCGSGCQTCVWDMYYDDLELYNTKRDAFLKALPQSHSAKP